MRAGRLVSLLRLLQAHERMTARELAVELEVSERTILRDIEALSGAGVPVYAVRGSGGGFELLGGRVDDLPLPRQPVGQRSGPRALRARLRLSPRGLQLAALLGRPAGVRPRTPTAVAPGRADWVEASVRLDSVAAGVLDLLALGPEVEVLRPVELRRQMAAAADTIAELHRPGATRSEQSVGP